MAGRQHLQLVPNDEPIGAKAIAVDGILDCVRQLKELFTDQNPGNSAQFWRVVASISKDLHDGLVIYYLLCKKEQEAP